MIPGRTNPPKHFGKNLRPIANLMIALAVSALLAGCGLAYQAGTELKTHHMRDSLKTGESALDVHKKWGEPDLRQDTGPDSEIWSYAEHANSNDVTATLLYTSTKAGDKGKFLDLNFADGKLVSWNEAEHVMPSKHGSGISFGITGPGSALAPPAPITHY